MKENVMKYNELLEGTNGSGETIYMVFTMKDDRCIWIERFNTKAEAIAWMNCCTY
jgi:hypothetical protein